MMPKLGLLLHSLLLVFVASSMSASAYVRQSSEDFIKTSCRLTRYPSICYNSLSGYATVIQKSHRKLAQTALSVSLERARSASTFVSRASRLKGIRRREYLAVLDCVETMGESVDNLRDAVGELNHTGRAFDDDFVWHMSNVQTWASAALTDEHTCIDGFDGRAMDGHLKTSIRRWIYGVTQVTSNALALVNHFAQSRKE